MKKKVKWSEQAVRDLGVTTNLPTACSVLALGTVKGYEMAAQGEFPVPVLRLGRKYVVPVAGLLAALGLEPTPTEDLPQSA